jgi:hypothetical protein
VDRRRHWSDRCSRSNSASVDLTYFLSLPAGSPWRRHGLRWIDERALGLASTPSVSHYERRVPRFKLSQAAAGWLSLSRRSFVTAMKPGWIASQP